MITGAVYKLKDGGEQYTLSGTKKHKRFGIAVSMQKLRSKDKSLWAISIDDFIRIFELDYVPAEIQDKITVKEIKDGELEKKIRELTIVFNL